MNTFIYHNYWALPGFLVIMGCLFYLVVTLGQHFLRLASPKKEALLFPSSGYKQQNLVEKTKSNYNLSIKPSEEKPIPIRKLYLYPIRGVQGVEVESIELTPLGFRFDRNWVIINAKTLKSYSNRNTDILTYLRL